MEKIMKAKNVYVCDYCCNIISIGEEYRYQAERLPIYDMDDYQIGIEYWHGRFCLNVEECCERAELEFEKSFAQ